MYKEKLKGKVKFINQDKNLFFETLKKRVDQYFRETNRSRYANAAMIIKTIAMLGMYLAPFIVILLLHPPFWICVLLWAVMGFGLAGVGMAVMHDANHGAYSKNKKINYLLGHTLNLLGGSVFNWKLQHNILHHTYTNVTHMDEDIDDKLVLRFSPHTPVKKYHKLQFVYAFFFYGVLTIYWVLLKDFIQFAHYTRSGVNANSPKQNVSTIIKIVLSKLVYLFVIFGVPVLFLGFSFMEILIGFFILQFIAGLILTVVFQLAHTVEGTSHPLPSNSGTIENSWAIHQMNTTVNFSRNSKWLSWYVGGLNFQIEHHLFPRTCHVHYPRIAGIVKATAEEFNIPYLENKTFGKALRSHISLLQQYGRLPHINEAIG